LVKRQSIENERDDVLSQLAILPAEALHAEHSFRFDEFKLDSGRFELYRSGRSLKLERKPMSCSSCWLKAKAS